MKDRASSQYHKDRLRKREGRKKKEMKKGGRGRQVDRAEPS